MTESNNPKDYTVPKRINNTIKNKPLKGMEFYSIIDLKLTLRLAVEFYNNKRSHWNLKVIKSTQTSEYIKKSKKKQIKCL